MKSHYVEGNEEAISPHDTADDHCWRDHRVGRDHLIGELEVLLLMLFVLILLSANWATYDTPNGASLVAAQRPVPELVRASVTP